MEENKYKSYEDQGKKGKEVFLNDFRYCQDFSREKIKRSEGSKGAGELMLEKKFIFFSCMKRNYWILKG